MGVRMVTGAKRSLSSGRVSSQSSTAERVPSGFAPNFLMQFYYDGVTTAGSGESPNLPGTDYWVDANGLYRLGLNIGPTFSNLGGGSCQIFGSNNPKDWAYKVNTDASLITQASAGWTSLGTITAGQRLMADGGVYQLMRLVFSGAAATSVAAVSL